MDLNLVVLAGELAAPIENRTDDNGQRTIRLLVTIRSNHRVDVVPVMYQTPETFDASGFDPGARVWIAGSMERRTWSVHAGRKTRLEVWADQISVRANNDK